jgi:hypothetical protein
MDCLQISFSCDFLSGNRLCYCWINYSGNNGVHLSYDPLNDLKMPRLFGTENTFFSDAVAWTSARMMLLRLCKSYESVGFPGVEQPRNL